jgi:hypothetical protein
LGEENIQYIDWVLKGVLNVAFILNLVAQDARVANYLLGQRGGIILK